MTLPCSSLCRMRSAGMLFALTLREMIIAVQLVVYSVHVNWLFLVGRPVQIYRSSRCGVAADYSQVTMQTSGSAHSRSRPSGPLHSAALDINMSRTVKSNTNKCDGACAAGLPLQRVLCITGLFCNTGGRHMVRQTHKQPCSQTVAREHSLIIWRRRVCEDN